MVTFTINIPQMLAYIPYMVILWGIGTICRSVDRPCGPPLGLPLRPGSKLGLAAVTGCLGAAQGASDKRWENLGKTMGNHGKLWDNYGKLGENHRKCWENHGK
jgi:hypothetical protein